MDAELLFRPAAELAELVRAGEVSSRELVEDSLARIEAVDGEINAFVHLDPDGALAAADAVGPATSGRSPACRSRSRTRRRSPACRSRWLRPYGDFAPDYDTFVVRRLREAGFVIVGKTNLPEFGILPVTEPRRFGPTRNPWDTERTPGGSSGGAAAAVAAGHGPARPRQRRRRLDPDPGGLLRPRRPEAEPRPHLARARPRRRLPRPGRRADAHGRGHRRAARRARRLRARRRHLGAAAERAVRGGRGARPGHAADRVDDRPPRSTRRSTRSASAPSRDAAELLDSLGHEVEEFEAPWSGDDLLATFTLVFGTPSRSASFLGVLYRPRDDRGAGRAALLDVLERDPRRTRRVPARAHAARRRSRARSWRCGTTTTCVLTPGLAQRPLRDRRDRPRQRRPVGRLPALGPTSRPTRRSST